MKKPPFRFPEERLFQTEILRRPKGRSELSVNGPATTSARVFHDHFNGILDPLTGVA